jgi:hypothetical protein
MEEPLTVLLIEPHRGCIDAFRDALRFGNGFGKCRYALSLQSAVDVLTDNTSTDIIFISHRFRRHEIKKFVAEMKPLCHESAFIQLSGRHAPNEPFNAHSLIQGMDGLLIEPLSVEALQSTAERSRNIKREQREKWRLAGLRSSIKTLVSELDDFSTKTSAIYTDHCFHKH